MKYNITYQSINYQTTKDISKHLAYKIQKEFNPELLIFVARGGHILASAMQEVLHTPIIDIDCSLNIVKKSDSLVAYLPEIVKKQLRMLAVTKKNPKKPFQKEIKYAGEQWKLYQAVKRILIIDDTVETGKTIEHILPIIEEYFKEAAIKVATLSDFDNSIVDYQVYQNTILAGPWGRDSKDYKKFVYDYEQYKLEKEKKMALQRQFKNAAIQSSTDTSYIDSYHALEHNKIKIKSFTK